jgi:hypothetical protein
MIRAIIDFIISVFKALFKLKEDVSQENQQLQQQHLQEYQENLQNQYNNIDEQHQVAPNPDIQEIGEQLNDHFKKS